MAKKSLLENISGILKVLRLYTAGIIAVGAMYFLLTGVDQGIDVVIQAGEYLVAGGLTVVVVVLWAYLIWYSCRILSYTKQKTGTTVSDKLLQLLPRMLAYNCFVCIQAAIVALPTGSFYHLSFGSILVFVVVQNAFYFILHEWFIHKKGYARWTGIVMSVVVVAFYGYLIYEARSKGATAHGPERHMLFLPVIAAIVFVLQVWAVYLFGKRRERIDRLVASSATPPSSKLAKYLNDKYAAYEAPQMRIFAGISIVTAAIYCLAVFCIPFASYMGPMPFVMLALGVLVGISNLISFFSIRIQINLVVCLLILALILGKFSDPYEVRSVAPIGQAFYKSRPTVKAYLYQWAKKRERLLDRYDSVNRFPIYVVLSDGGASRAGNWVCSALSSIQDSSVVKDSTDVFSDHLLAIAGASGGSVGNAAFYAMLRARKDTLLKGPFSPHCKAFFYGDFLTFTLARLLGPDFFRHIVPIRGIMDRGAALETVLSEYTDPIIDTQLARPLSAVFDTSGELPVFFITTTGVQDGMPSILGSTQLPENSQRNDVTKLLDRNNMDIRFATAAILSSRFPYVSPAGNIGNHYFVDGGYVDNAGAGIMIDFMDELEEIAHHPRTTIDDTTRLFDKFRNRITFHALHIYNSPEGAATFNRINPLTNDLLTPLLTLAGMQGSSTLIYTEDFKQNFKTFNGDTSNAIINYSLYGNDSDVLSYPMSWVISDYQLNRMHNRLDSVNRKTWGSPGLRWGGKKG